MNERTADPGRTHALIVGIEKYNAGGDWNRLNGPVADALELYRWLVARQVPRDQIQLLLSPRDDNMALVEQFGVEANPATSTQVRNAFNILHEEKGDLLFLFWAGHGIVSAEGHHRLFYADATQDDKRNLDLDYLLKSLGSSYFAGISRQILIIDACANYAEEMQWAFKLPGEVLPIGAALAMHEQFVFLAARDGQVAKNLGKEKRGLFSQRVLQQMSQTPASPWPPEMRNLAEKVQGEFAVLRASGEATQAPIYFWTRNWDGDSIALRTPALRETERLLPKKPWHLQSHQARSLTECLLDCDTMSNPHKRETVLAKIRSEIAGAVSRNDAARFDVLNIVTTASNYPGGLEELLDEVQFFEAGSLPWQRLEKLVSGIIPGFRPQSQDY